MSRPGLAVLVGYNCCCFTKTQPPGSGTHTDGPGGHNTKAVRDTPQPRRGTHTTQRTAALCRLDVDHTALRRVSVNRVGRGVGDGLGKAALGRAVGASKEESHLVLAMNGERDEAEMMGEEGVGGGAGKAVDGAVAMGAVSGEGGGGVEASEGADG